MDASKTDMLKKLKEPFPENDIEWRVQNAGSKDNRVWALVLAYVTNRAIQERLDTTVGPGNWKNEYKEWIGGSVLCGISIKIGDEWVTKWDGSDQTDIEAVKGGLSGAMKRAAVQWGIGRYLYNLEAAYAQIDNNGGIYYQSQKQGKYPAFRWNPPVLPSWALPEGVQPRQPRQTTPAAHPQGQPSQLAQNNQRPEQNKPTEQPQKQPSQNTEYHMLAEGEILPKWFWAISSEERQKYIPEGFKYAKINGAWTCIRANAA